MNALEAASKAPEGKQLIEIRSLEMSETHKLSIWNSGAGMTSDELRRACDIASSLGKTKDLDGNFGMGAKVASLPSNRFGMRYRSNANGVVSEVLLGERDGIYGRIRRTDTEGHFLEVIDVTDVVKEEGVDVSSDWTEVVLYGNEPTQDTVKDPFNGNPPQTRQWLADYLYHRFYRLPEGVSVRFQPGTHKLDGYRTFQTIPARAYPLGRFESVRINPDLTVHYFYDAPYLDTSHNNSLSGSISSDVSTCALIYKNEMYDLRKSKQWKADAPLFGVPFGARHISVHIELADSASVRPEAYRQFLRYKEGEQQQVLGSGPIDLRRVV